MVRPMLKLKDKAVIPPGGKFFYEGPLCDGMLFKMSSMDALLSAVTRYMQANEKPVPEDIAEQIEDWLCRRMPAGTCVDEKGRTANPSVNKTVTGVQRLTRQVQQRGDWGTVPYATVAERAACCRSCPNNIPVVGCASCVGLSDLITGMLRGRDVPDVKWLLTCRISQTFIPIELYVSSKAVKFDKKRSRYPATCWKAKINREDAE